MKCLAEFLVDHLGLRNSRFKLGVTALPKNKKKNNAGTTSHEGDLIVVLLNMRVDPGVIAQTLAHEMVHVKQIARGLLRQEDISGANKTIWWRGKKYDLNTIPYLSRPWELQALKLESLLVRTFEEEFISWAKRNKMKP